MEPGSSSLTFHGIPVKHFMGQSALVFSRLLQGELTVGEQRNKVPYPMLYVMSALALICSGKSVNVIPLRVDGFVNAIEFDDLGDWINFRFNLTYEALQDSRDEMKPLSELPASVCTGFRCLEFQITFVQFRILFSTSPRLTLTYFQLQEYVQVDHFSGAKRVTLTDLGGKCLRSKESFGEGEK
ncbi:hypothetical protein MJT46_005064 [Ovis ammon polii x Ovis aries]|nr:hypothetical protein MJT46_005064 [Ovis ammon polii x Ovis aries]